MARRKRNGKSWVSLILFLALVIVTIKFVPPVNDWARGNLPAPVLRSIGEEPKNFLERGMDDIGEGIEDAADEVRDAFK